MLIKTLVENTSISKVFGSEHGLSLYIETKKQKILFDVGASELFLQNAKKLDVDIADADLAAIAGGVFAAGNVIVTAVTSKRAGLPAPVQADRGPDFPAIDVPHAPSVDGPRGASSEG